MKLVIAEKPSVANSIADVLGADEKQDGYREGNGYIVSWCVGHLVELVTPDVYGSQYEKWSYESLPIIPDEFRYEVKSDTRKQYQILKNLMERKEVSSVVCATDAGREGELIFRLVFNQAKCDKPMERLWISSMEESAIRDGFDNLKPGREYDDLYRSALARQKADWLVGINGTRLFTVLYNGKTLKVGRVQTPTLAILVERETEIMNFKKKPFYSVVMECGCVKAISKRFEDQEYASRLANKIEHKTAVVTSVQVEEKKNNPPKLYDLTSLQRDANKIFGFTAKQTLDATQSLYEKKLVTYPRTDSQYLSDDMEETAKNVIAKIKAVMDMSNLNIAEEDHEIISIGSILNSKKVADHHAIIPTMEIGKNVELSDREEKILKIVACRLLAATSSPHVYEATKVVFMCEDEEFTASGKKVLQNGFKAYEQLLHSQYKVTEDSNEEETENESLEMSILENDKFQVENAVIKEGFTKPPSRYTEASLLKAMEKAGSKEMDEDVERKGLGTPATRADIIEKLVKDGFVKREKKQMVPTDDGMRLVTVLPDVVKSPQLTSDWENELAMVSKGEASYDDFMDGIEHMVKDLVSTYHSVSSENKDLFSKNKESFGSCPKCGKDVVKGKYGVYCSGKCGMTFTKAFGVKLNDNQIKNLLQNNKILVKGLKGKKGNFYDAYLHPVGIKEYSYEGKDGTVTGYQYEYEMTFPKKQR